MKVILELIRFTFIFFLTLTILGAVSDLTLSMVGVTEQYGLLAIIGSFILVSILYKKRGWDKVFNKKILWSSVIAIVLLLVIIPDLSPTHLHTTKYTYSYGFPFKFLTLYIENGTRFLIPNLFTGEMTGWVANLGVIGNFIFFYFSLRFIVYKFMNDTTN